MQKVVLLIVGATWLAVLVPPLLRSRGQNRPTSSVDHFRRNLAVLQQSAPQRINPLQSIGRPLTGGRPSLSDAYARAAMKRNPTDPRLRRTEVPLARRADLMAPAHIQAVRPGAPSMRYHDSEDATAPLQRRSETRALSRHALLRRRREQTVRTLLVLSISTALLALLAKSPGLVYVCALCVLSLFAYCAKLLRLRREAEVYAAQGYRRAA